MPIRILAPHEAAKIAAGEVIERPASVVKELIENSLDAGATQIAVEVREGGLALIRVADNGRGIEPGELRLAFERHATSKVAGEDDLWRISTLGFRGEALPSIAAAGEVELLTRAAGHDVGARIRLRDGAIAEEGAGAASPGTTFTVNRLFSAQPARLKFLRSAGAESSQISTVILHYALAYPGVRFELAIDGRSALQTTGSGSLVDAIAAVNGSDVAAAGIEIDAPAADPGGISVRGVAVEPRAHRATRKYIGLYVNGRWVRNRALTFAVEEAYQGMLPVGRHPIAVLDLRMAPDEVDVNVHPTKAEVRLRREREVFGALQRAVRNAVSAFGVVPSASPALWPARPIGVASGGDGADIDRPPLFLTQRPRQSRLMQHPSHALAGGSYEDAGPGAAAGLTADTAGSDAGIATMVERLPLLRAVGQVASMYIVAEGPDGMYLVDQHAAHERVLYEGFLASVRAAAPDVQGLLEPLAIDLPAAHRALIGEHADAFAALGFDIDGFGDGAYVVRALPASMARGASAQGELALRITELLDRMARDAGADGEAAREPSHRVAASLACHAAVRAGMSMDAAEQRELLHQLEGCASPRTCPHGRPTMVHLTAEAIARQFGRR
jgi:DNA mismatch repair protein MutL